MYKIKQPLIRLISLFLCCCCLLSSVPYLSVFSNAAESDLQSDFDNGLMTLSTSLTYYKQGVGHTALSSFDVTEDNAFEFSNIDYTFSKYNNPTLTFGHRFDLSYNDGSVLIPEGNSLTFTVRNFYSSVFPNDNFEDSAWLDMTKYKSFSMYFYDFNGTAYLVDKDMYELSIAQDNSLITVKMHSDMYDFDIYRLRLIIAFDFNAFYNYTNDFYYTEDSFLSNGSIKFEFGYAFLSFDIDSDEQVTTGLLTSIIEYVKSIWDSIKNLPANIKTSLSSLFDKISSGITNLGTSISGFFESLKTKLTSLFKGVTDGISNLYYSIAGRGDPGDSDYIPSLWQRIIDGIKGLFVPDDDFVDEWRESLSLTLEQHLGIVYQVPAITVDLFRNLISYSPFYPDTDGGYYFKLPTVRLYINLDNLGHGLDVFSSLDNSSEYGEAVKFEIFKDNSGGQGFHYYYFDFLEENPYSFFYSVYKIFSYFIVLILFLNYGWNKANQLFSS